MILKVCLAINEGENVLAFKEGKWSLSCHSAGLRAAREASARGCKSDALLKSSVSLLCRVLKQMLVRCVMEIHGAGCCETHFPADLKLKNYLTSPA